MLLGEILLPGACELITTEGPLSTSPLRVSVRVRVRVSVRARVGVCVRVRVRVRTILLSVDPGIELGLGFELGLRQLDLGQGSCMGSCVIQLFLGQYFGGGRISGAWYTWRGLLAAMP